MFWLSFFCLLFWTNTLGQNLAESDLRVISSSEQRLIVAFSPQHFQLEPLILNGKHYQKAHFRLVSYTGEPGEPLVPCRVVVVGIPLDGNVNVAVSASEFVEKQDVRLCPVPTLEREEGLPREDYWEGPVYHESGFVPGRLFEVEEPGLLGDQRIIRIRVYPVQFHGVENKIHHYTNIVLRVDFEGGGESGGFAGRSPDEDIYKRTLVNYDEARKWRKKVNQ